MRTHLTVAATLVASVLASTPAAHAAPVRASCALATVAQPDVTGSEGLYLGAAYGIAVFDDQDPHTLRCYVTVDGVEQNTTGVGAGNTVVTAAGELAYFAPAGSATDVCAEVDQFFPATRQIVCTPAVETALPPQPLMEVVDSVLDVLSSVADPFVDSTLCPVLATLSPGIPGVVDIRAEGDTTIAGRGVWDCPPYGNLAGAPVVGRVGTHVVLP